MRFAIIDVFRLFDLDVVVKIVRPIIFILGHHFVFPLPTRKNCATSPWLFVPFTNSIIRPELSKNFLLFLETSHPHLVLWPRWGG